MPSPVNNDELLDLVRKSGVLDEKRLDSYLAKVAAANGIPAEPSKFAGVMVRDGVLTHFQAEQFLQGKWRRFTIGRYKVLERLGAGGMGSVYLCEHKLMRRRVAVKVLPTAKADEPSSLERFYREARAVAALDHPNIVRAYDIDQDEKLHFLVMEFVDGANFQEIIKRTGPMEVLRAAHYIRQAALGIQHAHETAGLVHRDIKPGNILVDRNGIVKILDMGLARFFHDTDDILTKKYDENVLGTADYLAPEQALDSHGVDIRADIYSLGATFYFILTGRPPFAEGTIAQKLIWHQTRQPKSVRSIRPDVPEELAAILEKMMSKDPAQRYQTPMEIAELLAPWTKTPIPPPPEAEMPQFSLAAMGPTTGDPNAAATRTNATDPPSGTSMRKPWQLANGSPSSGASGQPTAPASAPAAPTAPAISLRKSGALPAAPPVSAPPAPSARPASPPVAKAPARPVLSPVPLRPTPAPAPNRPAVAPAPTPAAPPEEEEAASWDKLVTDTEDPSAQLDTAPRSAAKSAARSSVSRKGMAAALPQPPVSNLRLWIVVGAAAAAVAALIGLGVCLAILLSSGPKPSNTGVKEPTRVDPNGGGKYRTLREALQHAVANEHIVLAADIQEDEIAITKVENLTLESDPGRRIVWRFPDKPSDSAKPKLLNIDRAPNLQVKGISFDGGGKAYTLIALFGACPGLKLEDLEFKGIKTYGIYVANCDGSSGQPVTLSNLRFATTDDAQTALYFNFVGLDTSHQEPRAFVVQDLTFGPKGGQVKSSKPDLLSHVTLPAGVTPAAAPAQ